MGFINSEMIKNFQDRKLNFVKLDEVVWQACMLKAIDGGRHLLKINVPNKALDSRNIYPLNMRLDPCC